MFALAAGVHAGPWLARDAMPLGDFPGYVADIERVRDALLEHGRVPAWCVECYGGTTVFAGEIKERLLAPLAWLLGPLLAAKLALVLGKGIGAFGLYLVVARGLGAPAAGIVAGYAFGFGAIANHQLEHLDLAFAIALLAPILFAATALWRRGGIGPALALGVLTACQLSNQWVHALTVPVLVVLLAVLRPWDREGDARPWRDRRWLSRRVAGAAGALAVFAAFAASSLVWIAADARHHRLIPAEAAERQRHLYIERSPFLFVNRENALAGWLAEHQPPGFDLPRSDGGRRYVGGVVLVVCALGALAARRDPERADLRRWAAVAAGMALVQYGLALGPRTLLWQVAASLHWTPGAEALVRSALRAACGALALLALGLGALALRRADRVAARRARLAARAALAAGFPVISLWSAAALVLPALEVQRSPGRFFDTAPFWIYLLFAIALVALQRRIARPSAALAVLAAIAAAVAVDFAPSRRAWEAGTPMPALRRARAMVAGLPGEGGTLRLGLPIAYAPVASWVAAGSPAGHVWGWLPWRSGRHWGDLVAAATYARSGPRPDGRGAIEPDAALLDAMRVRYFLVGAGLGPLPPPWRRAAREGRLELWEQPTVAPFARGYRSALLLADESRPDLAKIVSRALRANTLALSAEGSTADVEALRRGAHAVVSPGDPVPRLPTAPEPFAVVVGAREPERIALEVDAGELPAVVSVSEGYHPWWRAAVDGEPAPILRANLAMLAVAVGPGRHALELRLVRPRWVAAGDALTAAVWAALCVGAPIAWARARRRAPGARR